jgi:hypothetical protein
LLKKKVSRVPDFFGKNLCQRNSADLAPFWWKDSPKNLPRFYLPKATLSPGHIIVGIWNSSTDQRKARLSPNVSL